MRKVSILRILLLLCVVNFIHIPNTPVLHYENMQIDAFATPFFIVTKYDVDEIINHERCHIKQMEEYGSVVFYVMNFYYIQKYGYYKNPFELQAYDNCEKIK